MRKRTFWQTLAGTALALSLGCGGGGGGGGGGPVQPPTPGLTFTPSAVAGANSVALQASVATATALQLDVTVQAVPGLYGLAFDVDFPATALRYTNSTSGDALASTNVPILLQVSETSAGHLVVGLSRTGSVAGISSATGVALSLRFDAVAAGNGAISFSRNHAFDQRGVDIAGTSWVGGTVAVVR